jgi:K(+)-stimulated pyrophosphate-energized sodium pump
MTDTLKKCARVALAMALLVVLASPALLAQQPEPAGPGGEASLVLPDLGLVDVGGYGSRALLMGGLVVAALGILFGLVILNQIKNLPVHRSMREISELIYETCKTYLVTQGKFIAILEIFIAVVIVLYFGVLSGFDAFRVGIILLFSIVGILGSYSVAWFGIRVNTYANSRTAFASLEGKAYPVYAIPLRAGMSIGMLLISVELLIMLIILLFIRAITPAPASSASPSASRSAPRRCALPAASSPRSPTSGPT